MKVYTINQKKKNEIIPSMKKTRMLLLVSVFLLALPLADDIGDSIEPITSYLIYILWGIFLILFVPSLVPKRLNNYRVEVDGTSIRQNKYSKKPIQISKIRFIKETKHGLTISTWWGRRVWVPIAMNKYDEIKKWVDEKTNPNVYKWYRMPELLFLIFLFTFPFVGMLIFNFENLDLEFIYIWIVAFLSNVFFIWHFE
jgi:hypothetical protein